MHDPFGSMSSSSLLTLESPHSAASIPESVRSLASLSRAYNNPLILWLLRTAGRRKAPSMRMTRRRCRPSPSNTTPALFRTWEFLDERMHAALRQYPGEEGPQSDLAGVAAALIILAAIVYQWLGP